MLRRKLKDGSLHGDDFLRIFERSPWLLLAGPGPGSSWLHLALPGSSSLPLAPRGSEPGGARKSQEEPRGASRSQEESGGTPPDSPWLLPAPRRFPPASTKEIQGKS